MRGNGHINFCELFVNACSTMLRPVSRVLVLTFVAALQIDGSSEQHASRPSYSALFFTHSVLVMPGVFYARVQASKQPLRLFNMMVGVLAVNICSLPSLPSLFLEFRVIGVLKQCKCLRAMQ
jgi:hypothetical protein